MKGEKATHPPKPTMFEFSDIWIEGISKGQVHYVSRPFLSLNFFKI